MMKKKPEYRGFTVHGGEYWLRKDQLVEELGCEPKEVEAIWKDGKRGGKGGESVAKESKKIKRQTRIETPKETEKPKTPSEEEVLASMEAGGTELVFFIS